MPLEANLLHGGSFCETVLYETENYLRQFSWIVSYIKNGCKKSLFALLHGFSRNSFYFSLCRCVSHKNSSNFHYNFVTLWLFLFCYIYFVVLWLYNEILCVCHGEASEISKLCQVTIVSIKCVTMVIDSVELCHTTVPGHDTIRRLTGPLVFFSTDTAWLCGTFSKFCPFTAVRISPLLQIKKSSFRFRMYMYYIWMPFSANLNLNHYYSWYFWAIFIFYA